MSTKQLQSWLDNHTAFRDRGPRFRFFTSVLFVLNLLAIFSIWIHNLLA